MYRWKKYRNEWGNTWWVVTEDNIPVFETRNKAVAQRYVNSLNGRR